MNLISTQCWLVDEEINFWIIVRYFGKNEIQMFAWDIFPFFSNRRGQHQNEINVSKNKITNHCDLGNNIMYRGIGS
jgi:hypothetical protein